MQLTCKAIYEIDVKIIYPGHIYINEYQALLNLTKQKSPIPQKLCFEAESFKSACLTDFNASLDQLISLTFNKIREPLEQKDLSCFISRISSLRSFSYVPLNRSSSSYISFMTIRKILKSNKKLKTLEIGCVKSLFARHSRNKDAIFPYIRKYLKAIKIHHFSVQEFLGNLEQLDEDRIQPCPSIKHIFLLQKKKNALADRAFLNELISLFPSLEKLTLSSDFQLMTADIEFLHQNQALQIQSLDS